MMTSYGGWAGKILRVNLTTGVISTEDTMKYKNFLGGMGLGYKVMWDEVPETVKAYDEANKIIFGVGPLTGSGVVCSSRTNITSLSPTHAGQNLITDGHMGGHFAAELKYAGWDGIIIEGKSARPVWLRIVNDKVSLEDASRLWNNGIYRATNEICQMMGSEAQVAAIGQAGENMVNMATIINSYSHSAGGHGGVMGSKKLKAIGVIGNNPVRIAGSKNEWSELDKHVMKIIGSNNQWVVPRFPQPWAEFNNPSSRWTARKGLYWGAAKPPVETGECHPSDMNSVGYRCQKALMDLTADSEKYLVRMGGCQSCPIRCHSNVNVPALEKYGYSANATNTCLGWSAPSGVMIGKLRGNEANILARTLGKHLADDYGVWCNYGQIGRDFRYAYENGILEKVLPEEEYKSIPFDLLEAGNPEFLIDFYRRIAFKEGEFSHLGDGAHHIAKRWEYGEDFYTTELYRVWNPVIGFPVHHSNESNGQVGALISCMSNRDAQNHSHQNVIHAGLPYPILSEICAELWGAGALDQPNNYTPMNQAKAKFTKWSIVRNVLHDSLTLCNWMFPMVTSPLKELGYRGDNALEAKFYSMVTGDRKTVEELDLIGERIFTLHRAMTIKQMGTMDMRNKHDVMSDWIFDKQPEIPAFSAGTNKMDREDMELAKTLFYREMGWDEKTGAPTMATYNRLGLQDVGAEMMRRGLVPSILNAEPLRNAN